MGMATHAGSTNSLVLFKNGLDTILMSEQFALNQKRLRQRTSLAGGTVVGTEVVTSRRANLHIDFLDNDELIEPKYTYIPAKLTM